MRTEKSFAELVGRWRGLNRLWLSPDSPVQESETTASVELAAGGAAALIRYTWAEGGRPQDGLILLRLAPEPSAVDMVWVDSWHMRDPFMLCRGELDGEGRLAGRGAYSAPPGPDWGWRIVVGAQETGELRIRMFNITPDGQEALAVDARYSRADS